jgi:hypothetical protein
MVLDILLSLPSVLMQLRNAVIVNTPGPVVGIGTQVELEIEQPGEENLAASQESVAAKAGTRTSTAPSEGSPESSNLGDREHITSSWVDLDTNKTDQ